MTKEQYDDPLYQYSPQRGQNSEGYAKWVRELIADPLTDDEFTTSTGFTPAMRHVWELDADV